MAEGTCVETECNREEYCRGLCVAHYSRDHRRIARERETQNPELADQRRAHRRWLRQQRPPCSVADCNKPRKARTYCVGHLRRWSKTGDVQPSVPLQRQRPRGESIARDAGGRKRCSGCARWLEMTEFTGNTRAPDGRQGYCRRCAKNAMLRRQFGMSIEEYEALIAGQGGGCAICGHKDRRLVVDHDHDCCPRESSCGGCIRGVLCHNCNSAIGLLGDEPNTLRAALAYLAST